jgi:hypothetical protein
MKKHGVKRAMDAFGVSRRTLFRLQRLLKESNFDPRALIPKSRAPRRRKQSQVPLCVIQRIRELREEFPNLGKAKVRVLFEPWCKERGIHCPSESTIGRIISRAKDKMRVTPQRLPSGSSVRHPNKVKQEDLDCSECPFESPFFGKSKGSRVGGCSKTTVVSF